MSHIQKFVANNQRMFKKTLSYYIMHITVAMVVGYIVTGNIWMAITLSLVEPTVQAVAYFISRADLGKESTNSKILKLSLNGFIDSACEYSISVEIMLVTAHDDLFISLLYLP